MFRDFFGPAYQDQQVNEQRRGSVYPEQRKLYEPTIWLACSAKGDRTDLGRFLATKQDLDKWITFDLVGHPAAPRVTGECW
jgi:hypothetical protein